MSECRWCHGTGVQYLEQGSSLCYACPDCGGTGSTPVCDICGSEYDGEYCTECYAECEECGKVCVIDDIADGLCEDCAVEAEAKEQGA